MRIDEEDRKQLVREVVEALEPRFQQVETWTLKLITDLREDTNKRFERIDKRFDALTAHMNRRFDEVDRRFAEVDRRFERLEKRIESWEAKLTDVRLEFYRELSRVGRTV